MEEKGRAANSAQTTSDMTDAGKLVTMVSCTRSAKTVAESEAERGDTQMIGQLLRPVGLGAEIDPDSSGSEPEHRDADDEKREMIPGRDGDDPGFDDLQHQGRCGNQS